MKITKIIKAYQEINKVIKLKQETEEVYEYDFLTEYEENSVFIEPRLNNTDVFRLILMKNLNQYNEDLTETDDEVESEIYWVNQLRSFQELVELEKRVPNWVSELKEDEIDQLINSLDSIQLTE